MPQVENIKHSVVQHPNCGKGERLFIKSILVSKVLLAESFLKDIMVLQLSTCYVCVCVCVTKHTHTHTSVFDIICSYALRGWGMWDIKYQTF